MTGCRLLPLLMLVLAGAAGAETSPYYIGVSQAFSHNTNLLGLPDDAATPAGFSKSDTTSSTSLLAGLDQPIGRQHLFGDVALRYNRMAHNDIYSNTSYSLAGGLDWSTINRISGSVNLKIDRSLASFYTVQIGFLTKKNVQTTGQFDAAVRAGVNSLWTTEATLGLHRVDYSAEEYEGREFRQTVGSLGAKYHPSAASTFGIAVRDSSGRYPKFRQLLDGSVQADEFTRQDLDFTARLLPTGATTLNARLSFSHTRYDIATQRDFSGITGRLGWDWQPTGKLHFKTELIREPGQESYFLSVFVPDATVDYSRIATSLRWRGDYQLDAKIALNTTMVLTRSSLTRTVELTGLPGNQDTGSESRSNFAIGATWTPLRSVQLGCDLGRQQRSGTPPLSSDLHATTYSCYGQLTLQ